MDGEVDRAHMLLHFKSLKLYHYVFVSMVMVSCPGIAECTDNNWIYASGIGMLSLIAPCICMYKANQGSVFLLGTRGIHFPLLETRTPSIYSLSFINDLKSLLSLLTLHVLTTYTNST